MSRLVEMAVDGEGVPAPPAAAAGPYALPSSLRRLCLNGDIAYWLAHLAGWPHLEQLQLNYGGTHQHASAHPAAVLKLVAQNTPGLRRLTCAFTEGATLTKQLPLLHGTTVERQAWLPCRPLAACTALQHLDVGRYLRVRDKAHWEALGALPALTALQGILVEGAPPPGWRHGGLQQLGAVVRLPGEEAAATAVVRSFPAARVVDVQGAAGGGAGVYQLPPLSGMGSLEELLVDGSTATPAAAAGAAGSVGLPSSLGRLQVEGSAAGWLQHLPATPHLTELQYEYDGEQHASAHPAAVLELVARHTPGLRSITCHRPTSSTSSASSSSSSGTWEGQEGAPQQLPPPEEQQQQAPAGVALAALTSLRHINAGGYLSVGRASHWQALRHLSALTSLQGIVVCQAPPHSWRHRHVQQLAVVLDGMGGESAALVLLAFPSLKQAQVCVVGAPGEQQPARGAAANAGEQQQGVAPVLALLTSLQLQYPAGRYEGSMSPAVHAAPMLAAARGVSELSFDGECAQQGGGVRLPDLSGATAVTRLRFGRSQVWEQAARARNVVAMVQPLAPTLRVLELSGMVWVSEKAALALEKVPRLKQVLSVRCDHMDYRELPELRNELRAGLVLSVSR